MLLTAALFPVMASAAPVRSDRASAVGVRMASSILTHARPAAVHYANACPNTQHRGPKHRSVLNELPKTLCGDDGAAAPFAPLAAVVDRGAISTALFEAWPALPSPNRTVPIATAWTIQHTYLLTSLRLRD